MKEIDWEERHFQICLALLSRADVGISGATNQPSIPRIIRTADKMVEALKNRIEEEQNATQPLPDDKAPEKPAKRSGGLWSQGMKRVESGITNEPADSEQ